VDELHHRHSSGGPIGVGAHAHQLSFFLLPLTSTQPKVFAGQLPFEVSTADVQNLFSQYGELRSCQVVSGPDGRSKGCAMIMFNSWTEAEMAVEAENNTTHLGGTKAMVVKFADPP